MKLAAKKIVPKLLNFKQKQRRMDIAKEMLTTFNDDSDLLKKVITADESWLYRYDINTKAQSSQRKRPEKPRSKKARQVRWNVKVLLTVFFDDCNDLVHTEFLPQDRTVNKEYYLEVMRPIKQSNSSETHRIVKKNQSWILHHNNESAHS